MRWQAAKPDTESERAYDINVLFQVVSVEDYLRCAGIDSVVMDYSNHLTPTQVSAFFREHSLDQYIAPDADEFVVKFYAQHSTYVDL